VARTWPLSTAIAASGPRPGRLLQPLQRGRGAAQAGDFDWDRIFASGVRWFHSGGIFASLSETTSELIIEGMQAAHKHGAVVSLDLNYREKLWAAAGGAAVRSPRWPDRRHVDVLVGNEEDLQKGLGIAGPEMTSKAASALDHSTFSGMIEGVVKRFPRIKVVATTLRHVHSTNRHSWSAVASINGRIYVAPTAELDVYDRVGAATALRPACSTVCSPASRPRSA
jgi:2-dehydro-3-deoxygluconokinase